MSGMDDKLAFNEDIFNEIAPIILFKGKGYFGDVFGPCMWNSKEYAIKRRMFDSNMRDDLKEVSGACEIWKSLNHKNLITVYEVSFDSPALYILMECGKGGSLREVLNRCTSDLPPEVLKNWITQIVEGMTYLHQKDIVHRDLKSPNIVIMEKDEVGKTLKIIDFDEIRYHDQTIIPSGVGTYEWMAPEVINQKPFTKASDVWSCGVVLWEMLTRKTPHKSVSHTVIIRKMAKKKLRLEVHSSCPEIIKKILFRCLHYGMSKRPSFDDIQRVLQNSADYQLMKHWKNVKVTSSKLSAIKFKKGGNVGETSEASAENELERHREWLEQHITPNSRLFGILRANRTLSWKELFLIRIKYSDCNRNSRLLNYILQKRHGDRLIAALRDTEQLLVVNYLIENSHLLDFNSIESGEIIYMSEDDSESQLEAPPELSSLPNITHQDMVVTLTINQHFIDRGISGAIYGPFRWKLKKCALKQILFSPDELTKDTKETIHKQADRYKKLDHEHLVKVFEVWCPSPALYILMEYAEGKSLDKVLRPKDAPAPLTPFSNDVVQNWALQIANGMRYLHNNDLVHRNLKSAHVLVMESPDVRPNTLKIGSYTPMKQHDHDMIMSVKGTLNWMAPEYIRGEPFSKLSDVWSYGVTVWEILTRDLPFNEMRKETDLVRGFINKTLKLQIPDSCPKPLQKLLTDCLNYEVDKRHSFTWICDYLREPRNLAQ